MISTDSVLTRENLGQPKWNRNFAHTILCFRRQNYSNTQKISPEIGPHRTVASWQYFVCCSTAHNITQQVEYIHFMLKTSLISDKGPFINYVVRILVVFDSFNPALPNSPFCWGWHQTLLINVHKSMIPLTLTNVDIYGESHLSSPFLSAT